MNRDFDLQCWYLHPERTSAFAGGVKVHISRETSVNEHLHKLQLGIACRLALVRRLTDDPPPSVQQLLLTDSLTPGSACTIYGRYRSRGLTQKAMRRRFAAKPPTLRFPIGLPDQSAHTVSVPLNPARFTADSTYGHFHRQDTSLLVAGFVESIEIDVITVLPCGIATLLDGFYSAYGVELLLGPSEVHIDAIGAFELVKKEPRPKEVDLQTLATVPEAQVKRVFASLLGEQRVAKDWGGEQSDMYSAHVVVNGCRLSAAFLFKGPSKRGPMTMVHLGKNGDQILRLSKEPAEFLVVQHCHEIAPAVRELMRLIASQVGRQRHYCIIDGYDTIRLLRAYGKCGFNPSAVQQS